VSIALTNYS